MIYMVQETYPIEAPDPYEAARRVRQQVGHLRLEVFDDASRHVLTMMFVRGDK